MRIAIACDHGGFPLKETVRKVLSGDGCEIIDLGTDNVQSVDYPDFAFKAVKALKEDLCDRIILICGTGIGMSICANRIPGVRATLCHSEFDARMARQHNDSNCLVLGSRTTGAAVAEGIVAIWLKTVFDGGRHQARLEKIESLAHEFIKQHQRRQ